MDRKKKSGFNVGPAHAPRNAYLGKGELGSVGSLALETLYDCSTRARHCVIVL